MIDHELRVYDMSVSVRYYEMSDGDEERKKKKMNLRMRKIVKIFLVL